MENNCAIRSSDTEPVKRQKEININLELIKLLACVAVIGLHTLNKGISVLDTTLYYLCGFAVPCFFMSSGYVLLKKDGTKNSICKYSLAKISRILRLVTIWNILVFLTVLSIKIILRYDISNYNILYPVEETVKSLIQMGTLWHFWYMGALIILYILLPFLHSLKDKKNLFILWGILVIISICIQLLSYIYGFPLQKYIIQTFRIWTWTQYFILGYLVRLIFVDLFEKYLTIYKHLVMLVITTMIVLLWQIFGGKVLIHNSYAEFFYDSAFTILWCIVLFSFVLRIELKDKSKNRIRFLSQLILGVYIIHPLISKIFGHFLSLDNPILVVVYFLFIMVISFVFTCIIYKTPLKKFLLNI